MISFPFFELKVVNLSVRFASNQYNGQAKTPSNEGQIEMGNKLLAKSQPGEGGGLI